MGRWVINGMAGGGRREAGREEERVKEREKEDVGAGLAGPKR